MEAIVIGSLVFGLAYAFTHRGGKGAATDEWQPGARGSGPVAASVTTLACTAPASPLTAGSQRAASVQLARIEGRQLLRNEVFIVGIAMSVAMLVVFGVIWASDNIGAQNSWRFELAMLPVFTLPFAGLTLVAVSVAALRSSRDGTDELFGSLPASDATCIVGHLGSVWMAYVVQVLFLIGSVLTGLFVTHRFGAIDAASVGDIAVSFGLVVCAVSLGVALARWLPHPLVAIASLVVLGIAGSAIGGIGGHHWSLTRQLSIWPRYPDHDWAFAIRPTWWHAAYLLSLAAVVAIAAVARHRRDRVVAGLGALAVALAVITGVVQTRPMSNHDADRIAAMVADPAGNSTCREREGLTLCAYHDYADITDTWAKELTAPFAAVPRERRDDGFTVLWREPMLDRLDPAVQQRIDIETLTSEWAADPSIWNGVTINGTDSNPVNRLALGLWSVGLPNVASQGVPCSVGGQARGVLALWVAAQGKDTDAARSFVSGSWSGVNNPEHGFDFSPEWRDGYVWNGDVTPPVLWSKNDIAAAQALVNLDSTTVRDAVWSDWTRWTDSATATDELLASLGLAPAGAIAEPPSGTVVCE